jgi:hypothetical protein
MIGSIKEDENESCQDNEEQKEDSERILKRELLLMDPLDACKAIVSRAFEKRGMEQAKTENSIASWEVGMRVNDNGRIKLCSYIV